MFTILYLADDMNVQKCYGLYPTHEEAVITLESLDIELDTDDSLNIIEIEV